MAAHGTASCPFFRTSNEQVNVVALAEIDRSLLQRCLAREPRSWQAFVDRFLGLVVHVVNHTAQCRSFQLTAEDREDLVSEVFLTIVADDFAVLRRFNGHSSLATYLTVIARRVVVRELFARKPLAVAANHAAHAAHTGGEPSPEQRISDREEVERMLAGLADQEADVVRQYHLEGKSYHEISESTGLAENSIGPTLTRARAKMRAGAATSAT